MQSACNLFLYHCIWLTGDYGTVYTGRYLEASNLATQRDTGGWNVCIWQCHAEHSYLQLTITLLSAVHVLHTLWYSPSIEDNVHVEVSDKVSSKQQASCGVHFEQDTCC